MQQVQRDEFGRVESPTAGDLAPMDGCTICDAVPESLVEAEGWRTGHVFIRTFTGLAYACSGDGQRILRARALDA